MASRSGDKPIVLLGILHQGFHAYAERLPSSARQEWEKIAGRFEEIVFDQPLTHTATLVASALNVQINAIPPKLALTVNDVVDATVSAGGMAHSKWVLEELSPLQLYPLHPTVLPVLIHFFARFGQHERSLFGFLFSSEPFGLQSFAQHLLADGLWYRLPDLYDYIRATFGHRLAGASATSQWLRISGIIDVYC